MASKSSKVVTGCGIGCGVVVLILIIAGVVVFTFFKNLTEDVEKIDQANELLIERFGKVEEYALTSNFTEERITQFFDAREAIISRADKVTAAFAKIDSTIAEDEDDDKSFWEVIGIINTGVDMIPDIYNYYTDRSTVLLANDMPLGEYYIYYVTAYFSYLKSPLDDGPLFNMFDSDGNQNVSIHNEKEVSTEDYIEEVKDSRKEELSKMINRAFRKIFKNSIARSSDENLKSILEKELELLEDDHKRIPWSDGLPDELKTIYENFDTQINKTYIGKLNPIELRNIDD